jgi:hypothetical protein
VGPKFPISACISCTALQGDATAAADVFTLLAKILPVLFLVYNQNFWQKYFFRQNNFFAKENFSRRRTNTNSAVAALQLLRKNLPM